MPLMLNSLFAYLKVKGLAGPEAMNTTFLPLATSRWNNNVSKPFPSFSFVAASRQDNRVDIDF